MFDPIFAIIITFIIMRYWYLLGKEKIIKLSGVSAPDKFLKLITFIAWNHHNKIKCIENVRAYHISDKYLVEIHIVLDKEMPLSEAHDIGESLKMNIDQLKEVEKCFVHLDYNLEHDD